jgi:hypothetical protein
VGNDPALFVLIVGVWFALASVILGAIDRESGFLCLGIATVLVALGAWMVWRDRGKR